MTASHTQGPLCRLQVRNGRAFVGGKVLNRRSEEILLVARRPHQIGRPDRLDPRTGAGCSARKRTCPPLRTTWFSQIVYAGSVVVNLPILDPKYGPSRHSEIASASRATISFHLTRA